MSILRTDLPLGRDASGRFLPWIIGFMVYLAALALAGTMALDGLVERWNVGLAGSLTVQLPPAADAAARRARADQALDLLSQTPEVASAELLDDKAMARLLEPWLGADVTAADLPLPDLIAVTLQAGAALDLDGLRQRLDAAVPGALVDDHGRWLDNLMVLARSVDLLAVILLSLVGGAAAVTVVFVTRTGLAIHRRVIEVVHLIGATDAYVARQFQAHALRLGLVGGLLGLALAALTLRGIAALLQRIDAALMPSLSLDAHQWLILGLLPVGAALVAMATARFTVLRSLDRIM